MLKILTDFKTESDFNFLQDKYKDKPITIFNDRLPRSYDELNYNPYNDSLKLLMKVLKVLRLLRIIKYIQMHKGINLIV